MGKQRQTRLAFLKSINKNNAALSNDTLYLIFPFLDVYYLLSSIELVCKEWNQVSRHDIIWRQILSSWYPHVQVPSDCRRAYVRIVTSGCYVCGLDRDKIQQERFYYFTCPFGTTLTVCNSCMSNKYHVESSTQEEQDNIGGKGRSHFITKTLGKTEYCFTDKEIVQLPCIEKNNPHQRNGPLMRLYIVRNLEHRACIKYDGIIGLEQERERRTKSKQKRKQTRQDKMIKRRIDLESALKIRGLESYLYIEDECREYIQGKNKKSIQEIVGIVARVDFYCKRTNYTSIKREQFRNGGLYNHDREQDYMAHIISKSKHMALEQWIHKNRNKSLQSILELAPLELHETITALYTLKNTSIDTDKQDSKNQGDDVSKEKSKKRKRQGDTENKTVKKRRIENQ
jgi:hypothetical protein